MLLCLDILFFFFVSFLLFFFLGGVFLDPICPGYDSAGGICTENKCTLVRIGLVYPSWTCLLVPRQLSNVVQTVESNGANFDLGK